MPQLGKTIILIGIIVLIIGVIIYLFGDKFTWVGNLPGDIRIKKPNFTFYFPITTMILVSIILSLLLRIFRYLF